MPQGEAKVPVAGLQARGHDRSGDPSDGGGLGIGAAEMVRRLSGFAERCWSNVRLRLARARWMAPLVGSAGVAVQPGLEVLGSLEVEQGIGQVFEIAEG